MVKEIWGVWANKDIELVIAEDIILKFERKQNLLSAYR